MDIWGAPTPPNPKKHPKTKKLNNKQGLPVKTGGGGYNCRHSWSPVSEGFIKAAGLDRATTKDISKANTGAKR